MSTSQARTIYRAIRQHVPAANNYHFLYGFHLRGIINFLVFLDVQLFHIVAKAS